MNDMRAAPPVARSSSRRIAPMRKCHWNRVTKTARSRRLSRPVQRRSCTNDLIASRRKSAADRRGLPGSRFAYRQLFVFLRAVFLVGKVVGSPGTIRARQKTSLIARIFDWKNNGARILDSSRGTKCDVEVRAKSNGRCTVLEKIARGVFFRHTLHLEWAKRFKTSIRQVFENIPGVQVWNADFWQQMVHRSSLC